MDYSVKIMRDAQERFERQERWQIGWIVIALAVVFMLGCILGWLVDPFTKQYDPLDVNKDGKVTLTDLVITHRTELKIKARLLGLPDPFTITPTIEPTVEPTAAVTLTITEPLMRPVWVPEIDNKEYMLFVLIVARETTKMGGYEGALDVATVILNRRDSGRWGDSITDVVSASGQFSTYAGWTHDSTILYEFYWKAVDDALAGKRSLSEDTLYFRTYASYDAMPADKQAGYEVVARRNGHVFMRGK